MNSIWASAQNWKLLSLAALSTLPFTGFYFLNSKTFNWKEPKGVNAHIKLFLINENNPSGMPAAASLATGSGGGSSQVSNSYVITQVSAGSSSSGKLSENNKLALVAKMPLDSIDKSSSWEYCLPTSSPLSSNVLEPKQIQAADVSQSHNDNNCELKLWTNSSGDTKGTNSTNNETIKYLLELISKYIRLQHQVNMIYLFHANAKTPESNSSRSSLPSSTNDDESWKKVKSECGFLDNNTSGNKSNLTKQMLLTVTDQSKKCMPFPLLVTLYLKLKSNNSAATATSVSDSSAPSSTSSITTEKIKGGELWGQISYGLTDYWGNVKQLKKKNGETNSTSEEGSPVLIDVPVVLNYDLSSSSSVKDNCSNSTTTQNGTSTSRNFEHLWEKYEAKTLRLCDYFQSKVSQHGK